MPVQAISGCLESLSFHKKARGTVFQAFFPNRQPGPPNDLRIRNSASATMVHLDLDVHGWLNNRNIC